MTLDQVSGGALTDPRISPEQQISSAAHPASAAALVIAAGGPAVERGSVVPDFECLGAVFPLAGGEAGVLSRTLPYGPGIEQFVKARYRVCETIGADVHSVERDGVW